jgi:hypothetical protein
LDLDVGFEKWSQRGIELEQPLIENQRGDMGLAFHEGEGLSEAVFLFGIQHVFTLSYLPGYALRL